jgi:hypothetical protein
LGKSGVWGRFKAPCIRCPLLQEAIVKRVRHTEPSIDVRSRLSAVLLELTIRYADALVSHTAADDHVRLRAASAFDTPAEPPVDTRSTPSRYSRALSLVPVGSSSNAANAAKGRDTPASLLSALAAALDVHAATVADGPLGAGVPEPARDALLSFINFACTSPPLLEEKILPARRGWGPTARAAYLRVLQAYACAPRPAELIAWQLKLHSEHDDYLHISWHEFFKLAEGLHAKYVSVSAESRIAAPQGALLCCMASCTRMLPV